MGAPNAASGAIEASPFWWHGTPLPPLEPPIPALRRSPELDDIADRVWRWGGAETACRHGRHFLYAIIDRGTEADCRFILKTIPREVWREALASARPGEVCRAGHRLFSLLLGLDTGHAADWPDHAHYRDVRRGHFRRLRARVKARAGLAGAPAARGQAP